MSFTQDDVPKLTKLARLKAPNEKDSKDLVDDLSNILKMVNQIANVNTENVEPMSHPLNTGQRLRVDEITESDVKETMQSLTPKGGNQGGLYLVPKVVE